jgi:hypothetical protein
MGMGKRTGRQRGGWRGMMLGDGVIVLVLRGVWEEGTASDFVKDLVAMINDTKRTVGVDPGATWKATTSDGRCIPRELLVPRNTNTTQGN